MSNGSLGKNQLLGRFVVGDQIELNGLLTLSSEDVSLYIWDTSLIDVTRMKAEIYGILHDNRVATLFDCVLPTRPGLTLGANHGTSRATIVPNNIVFGPDRFSPSSGLIDRVMFRTDDTNLLFNDRSAFKYDPGSEDDPSIRAKYSGEDSIFSIDTSMGRVSAFHHIQNIAVLDVSEGVEISTKVYFEIEFMECLSYYDAIRRAQSVISFVALLMGRPQNLVEMSVIAGPDDKGSVKRRYDVGCSTFQKCVRVGDSDRVRAILGRLFDVATERTLFASVLASWLARDDEWRGARNRFDKCTSRQLVYDEDRIVGAANMFDLLPDSAVGPRRLISETSRRAIRECKRILRKGRISPGDNEDPCNEALRWIGRINHKSLRQKIHYRAEIVLCHAGDHLPQLKMVIGEAVKRRNLYVHGPEEGSSVSHGESGSLIFLTSTLEFVFGASDLIESGWDVANWMARRTGDHPFGRYVADYKESLGALESSMRRC